MTEIKYIVSTFPAKYAGYQSKSGTKGTITMYVSTIWLGAKNFKYFVQDLILIELIERICVETAFQQIRIKGGRCTKRYDGLCIIQYIVNLMIPIIFP